MKRFFTIFALIVCIIPIAAMLIFGASPPGANETPASVPSITTVDGMFNRDVLSNLTSYLDKHFAFRQELITFNSEVMLSCFGVSPVKDVIIGKDDWLFYEKTTDDYLHKNVLEDEEIAKIVATLKETEQLCKDNGIQFLFVIAPNKNSVYPQYMPYLGEKQSDKSNAKRLLEKLSEEGVSHINLFDTFKRNDDILYHKLDSHWNNLGAATACDEILRALNRKDENFAGAQYEITNDFDGDLYRMLYPKGHKKDQNVDFSRKATFTYDEPISSADSITIKTTCNSKEGTVMVFRDSFGNALYPFIAESFEKAVFSRKIPYNPDMALEYGADTLLFIMAERNIAQFEKHLLMMK